MDSFETEYRWAQKGWADCRDALQLAQKELDELRTRAQRLEASLVLVEDQRDKASKERDALRKQLDEFKRDYTDTSYWGKE